MESKESKLIISAMRILDNTKDGVQDISKEKVYLAEDCISGGYCYWTTKLDRAKTFVLLSDALEYTNPSFNCIVNEVELGSINIQLCWVEFDTIYKYK